MLSVFSRQILSWAQLFWCKSLFEYARILAYIRHAAKYCACRGDAAILGASWHLAALYYGGVVWEGPAYVHRQDIESEFLL